MRIAPATTEATMRPAISALDRDDNVVVLLDVGPEAVEEVALDVRTLMVVLALALVAVDPEELVDTAELVVTEDVDDDSVSRMQRYGLRT